jgi:uncharacterized protein (DUF362 family)
VSRPASYSRRTVVAAGMTAACGPRGPKPAVRIVKADAYDQRLFEIVRRLFTEARLDVRGKRVVLKPNLVEFDAATCVNTNPVVVHAAIEAVRALGAAQVRIAEGPGHRRVTREIAEAAGYRREIPEFDKLFVDLNLDDVREVNLSSPHSSLRSLYLPVTVLGADLLISIPKLKTHHWVGATLSMKNLFGIVPGAVYGWPKNVLHWAGIDECIADLQSVVKDRFCLVDGIVGMEGNGPIQGTPKQAGVLVAGADMPAVDATCCRIMRLDPTQIGYLKLAAARSQTREDAVEQAGETIASVASPFAVIEQWKPLQLGPPA